MVDKKGSLVSARRPGSLLVAFLLLVLLAPTATSKSIKNTARWFSANGEAMVVRAQVDGKSISLLEAADYLASDAYAARFAKIEKMVRAQSRSDTIPCTSKGGLFRYRSRDPQRPLSPVQDWTPWREGSNRNLRWSHQGLSLAGCYLRRLDGPDGRDAANDLKKLVADWYAKNAVVHPPDPEFSWGDHTTAFRLRRIVAIYLALRDRGMLDEKWRELLLKMAYAHTRVLLEDRDLRMRGSNHALDQAQAMFLSAMTFPFLDYKTDPGREAYSRAIYEAGFLVAQDGVETENSPAYHQWVPDKVFGLLQAMAEVLGTALPQDMIDRMNGATRFATWIARPDGALPMIGDTGYAAPVRFTVPSAVGERARDEYRFVRYQGKNGSAPNAGLAIFKDSGYLIFRNRWSKGIAGPDVHMVFKCGFLSDGHRHNDDGSIVLYGFGTDWLTDAGMYGYERDDPKRQYAVSPSAHNVSLPIGMSTIGRMSSPRYKAHRRDWGLTPAASGLGAACRSYMYADVAYDRTISFEPGQIDIVDSFDDGAVGPHALVTLFRIPADKAIKVDKHAGTVDACARNGNGRCMRIAYQPDVIQSVAVSVGADQYGFSFDTVGYLKTRDVQTVRLFWKSGATKSAYGIGFPGDQSFRAVAGPAGGADIPSVEDLGRPARSRAVFVVAGLVGLLLVLGAVFVRNTRKRAHGKPDSV